MQLQREVHLHFWRQESGGRLCKWTQAIHPSSVGRSLRDWEKDLENDQLHWREPKTVNSRLRSHSNLLLPDHVVRWFRVNWRRSAWRGCKDLVRCHWQRQGSHPHQQIDGAGCDCRVDQDRARTMHPQLLPIRWIQDVSLRADFRLWTDFAPACG